MKCHAIVCFLRQYNIGMRSRHGNKNKKNKEDKIPGF